MGKVFLTKILKLINVKLVDVKEEAKQWVNRSRSFRRKREILVLLKELTGLGNFAGPAGAEICNYIWRVNFWVDRILVLFFFSSPQTVDLLCLGYFSFFSGRFVTSLEMDRSNRKEVPKEEWPENLLGAGGQSQDRPDLKEGRRRPWMSKYW